MSKEGSGEPWFLLALGPFGARAQERLALHAAAAGGIGEPALVIRVEEGAEQRRLRPAVDEAEGKDRRGARRSLRIRLEGDAALAFDPDGGSGKVEVDKEVRTAHRALSDCLREGFIGAYAAQRYLERRAHGDDRPVTATTVVLADLTDPFSQSALVALPTLLRTLTRELLAPLFQASFQNVELLVVGAIPFAQKGADAIPGARACLQALEALAIESGDHRLYLRAFLLDDRSDRYLLSTENLAEQAALLLPALVGEGAAADPVLRGLRSAAGDPSRHAPPPAALFGTFSAAALTWPGERVVEYCRLRQAWETLREFQRGTRELLEGVAPIERERTWLAELRRSLDARLEERLSQVEKQLEGHAQRHLSFLSEVSRVEVGLLTDHTELGDPSHAELGAGFQNDAPPLLVPLGAGGRGWAREYPFAGGPAARHLLFREAFGVRTLQPHDEDQEPAPTAAPTTGSVLERFRSFVHDALTDLLPRAQQDADRGGGRLLGEILGQLRREVDEQVRSGPCGWAQATVKVEALREVVAQERERAQQALCAASPARYPKPARVLEAWQRFRQDLAQRPSTARYLLYGGLAFAAWVGLLHPAVALVFGPALSHPLLTLGIGLLVASLVVVVPLWLSQARGTRRLQDLLETLEQALRAHARTLREDFFRARTGYARRLWEVRWLTELRDELELEREHLRRVDAGLTRGVSLLRRRLESLGVRFSEGADGEPLLDDSEVFSTTGLFERWLLPGTPLGTAFATGRRAPGPLATAYCEAHRPFDGWRNAAPFEDLDGFVTFCGAEFRTRRVPNPFDGALDLEDEAAVGAFLRQFTFAGRAHLQVRALPAPPEAAHLLLVPRGFHAEARRVAAATGVQLEVVERPGARGLLVLRVLKDVPLNRLVDLDAEDAA